VRRADILTTFKCLLFLILTASTYWNSKGLYRDCFLVSSVRYQCLPLTTIKPPYYVTVRN